MIVVADTSCICYLILLNSIELLPRLYGSVVIPNAVYSELQAENTPTQVKRWIEQYPQWLQVEFVEVVIDSELEKLDRGETEAIALAETLRADLIILDDRFARTIARERGLTITGLLGVLYDAAIAGEIDLSEKFEALQTTSLYVNPNLLLSLLQKFEQFKIDRDRQLE